MQRCVAEKACSRTLPRADISPEHPTLEAGGWPLDNNKDTAKAIPNTHPVFC